MALSGQRTSLAGLVRLIFKGKRCEGGGGDMIQTYLASHTPRHLTLDGHAFANLLPRKVAFGLSEEGYLVVPAVAEVVFVHHLRLAVRKLRIRKYAGERTLRRQCLRNCGWRRAAGEAGHGG